MSTESLGPSIQDILFNPLKYLPFIDTLPQHLSDQVLIRELQRGYDFRDKDPELVNKLMRLKRLDYLIGMTPGLYDKSRKFERLAIASEKLALVGPPQTGKTTLSLSINRVLPYTTRVSHWDVFSFGSQHAIAEKKGWLREKQKRDPEAILKGDDINSAIYLLRRIKEFRESRAIIALADTPGKIRTEADWFYQFFARSIDGFIVLGRSDEDFNKWGSQFADFGVKTYLKIFVAETGLSESEVSGVSYDVFMRDLGGHINLLNRGVLVIAEKLLELAVNRLSEEKLLSFNH